MQRLRSCISAFLFDQGSPESLRRSLTQYESATAFERGWSTLKNGELLDAAGKGAIAMLVTTDSNLKYQQNLTSRRIAIVVHTSPSWPRIQRIFGSVVRAIGRASAGSHTEVEIP